jgi:SOS-response transcriptional repressor LexA
VLVQYRGVADPETGGAFTVKRYLSDKRSDHGGSWSQTLITLKPLNSDYEPIVLRPDSEGDVTLVAEYVATI